MTMNQSAIAARPSIFSWRRLAAVIIGAALLAASSYIEVPFFPVPMTLQTMVVLGLGLAFGFWSAIGSVLLYLAAGIAGAPVFAGGAAGPLVLTGPTGGYLVGFLLASGLCGLAHDRGLANSVPGAIFAAILGAALIYLPGLAQLGTVIGWDKPVLELGLYPFMLGDVVKALLAALGTVAIRRSFARQA